MSSLPIDKSDIQAHTAGGSYERGREYLEEGAVQSLTLDDEDVLKARVQGSDIHPYVVEVRFSDDGVERVECTCPYHEGTWCKHAAAVLLGALEAEDISTPESARVAELVRSLDRDALIELLKDVVERIPDLLDVIEQESAHLSDKKAD